MGSDEIGTSFFAGGPAKAREETEFNPSAESKSRGTEVIRDEVAGRFCFDSGLANDDDDRMDLFGRAI